VLRSNGQESCLEFRNQRAQTYIQLVEAILGFLSLSRLIPSITTRPAEFRFLSGSLLNNH
jgi:hypothetical protein